MVDKKINMSIFKKVFCLLNTAFLIDAIRHRK
jgi:hypothetical protein